jgi:hypothetical protein
MYTQKPERLLKVAAFDLKRREKLCGFVGNRFADGEYRGAAA